MGMFCAVHGHRFLDRRIRSFRGEIINLGRNEVLNSNTWGLFVAPFLIYLFVTRKGWPLKILVFFIGLILLYLTGARTTLIAFATLPLFMVLYNWIKRPRLIYLTILLIGLGLTYIAAYLDSEALSVLLSRRDIIWEAYLNNVTHSIPTILTGTGAWKAPIGIEIMEGHGAHNTFLSLFHYNGLIALALYLAFIVFSVKNNAREFTVSDGVLYLAVVFQFLESNVPLFTYIFPSFIFVANVSLNKLLRNNTDTKDIY